MGSPVHTPPNDAHTRTTHHHENHHARMPRPANTATEALATIESTHAVCKTTLARIDASTDSAEETLAAIRSTLDRWDNMKARFSQALDGAIIRIVDALRDQGAHVCPPDGLPTGKFAHGIDGALHNFADPRRVVDCKEEARPKMSTGIPAHEYHDEPAVLRTKVQLLADMIRSARCCVAYTGAGISTAAGIGDYASRAGSRSSVLPKKLINGTPFDPAASINAIPTVAHRTITALHANGLLEGGWVQQNHDGLPQKAGFPQESINEIHGSWFDPSNPVVPMEGRLRADLVARLGETKQAADLVLVMRTSLSGVWADSLVSHIGGKHNDAMHGANCNRDEIPLLGAVIVNVQATRLDGIAALRIFAPCDKVCELLAAELSLSMPSHEGLAAVPPTDDVWRELPYDPSTGAKLSNKAAGQTAVATTLVLRAGRRVKLALGNAPMAPEGLEGVVGKKTAQGHYAILFDHGKQYFLGLWILTAAQRGTLDVLPLLNVSD